MKARYVIYTVILLLSACNGGGVPTYDVQPQRGDTLRDNMIAANRIIAQSEETQIDAYAQRHGYQMERTPEGARIMVTRAGKGAAIGYEDSLQLRYSVGTLAGQTIYQEVEEAVVCGHLKPTRGLDAALRTLHRGDRAVVILPSEQAYGVVGDGNRIGSRIVLIYDIEIK